MICESSAFASELKLIVLESYGTGLCGILKDGRQFTCVEEPGWFTSVSLFVPVITPQTPNFSSPDVEISGEARNVFPDRVANLNW
jgi:hypothetical protein